MLVAATIFACGLVVGLSMSRWLKPTAYKVIRWCDGHITAAKRQKEGGK